MQKPTGKPGAQTERIFWCIAIERHIQDEATAVMLGVDSAESNHSRDIGSGSLSEIDVVALAGNVGDMQKSRQFWEDMPILADTRHAFKYFFVSG